MKEFNLDEARDFLETLKKEEPAPPDTMKSAVLELMPQIRELVAKGYTRKAIYDLLMERFDLKISYGTFRSYLYQAERKANRGGRGDA